MHYNNAQNLDFRNESGVYDESTPHGTHSVKPIVLMHGILSDAPKIQHVADWLTENTGGAQVINMEIGNGKQDSARLTMPDQLAQFCQNIRITQPRYPVDLTLSGLARVGF